MGYVHNTKMAFRVPLQSITTTVGTWAMAVASNIWTLNKTAGDNTSVLCIPVNPPQNSAAFAGSKITSIDVYYINATANLDAMSAKIWKASLPASAGTLSTAEVASSSTFALTQAQHKVTITPTTPFYLLNTEDAYVELTVDSAAGSVIKLQAVVVNYTLRV